MRRQWIAPALLLAALTPGVGAATLEIARAPGGSLTLEVTTAHDASSTLVETATSLGAWSPFDTLIGPGVTSNYVLPTTASTGFFRATTTPIAKPPLGDVWCLGDSWTACHAGRTWRRQLWQDLDAGGWSPEFIGTLESAMTCEPGETFDRDHDGVQGITALEVLEGVDDKLAVLTPDTVLLLIGGNDGWETVSVPEVVGRIGGIVERIRSDNPAVTVHIGVYGYVTSDPALNAELDAFAAGLEAYVDGATTPGSQLFLVDHRAGWDTATDLAADGFHPSNAGMEKIAGNWFDSIAAHQVPGP